MKKLLIFFYILSIHFFAKAEDPEVFSFEAKKKYNLKYTSATAEKLFINNSFGDVKVSFGPQHTVTVNINVLVLGMVKETVEETMKNIIILENQSTNFISVKTKIPTNLSSRNYDRTQKLKIDYVIVMPSNMALDLSNSFGEVDLPNFTAPLNVNIQHCKINGPSITNVSSKLNLSFANADFGRLENVEILSNHGRLNANELKSVLVTDNHGELRAKILENVSGTLNYTEGIFENIKDKLDVKLNFSEDFQFKRIDAKAKKIKIISNYSNVDIPLLTTFSGFLDIKSSNGKMSIRPDIVTSNIMQTENNQILIKKFKGKVGKPSDQSTKIIIICNNGEVSIK